MNLIWTPNAETGLTSTFDIGSADPSPYQLLFGEFGGFSGASTTQYTGKSPYQQGQSYYAQVVEERAIDITFRVIGTSFDDLNVKKRTIARYFAPASGAGTLRVSLPDGSLFDIVAVPDGAPLFNDRRALSKHSTICTVYMIAYSPFWFDPSEKSMMVSLFSGGFTIPFTVPFGIGMVGGGILTNSGHVPTPVRIIVPGPMTDPVIENTRTGEKISVTQVLVEGEYLTIDTSFEAPIVTFTSDGVTTSLFDAVSADSEFFQLLPGDNMISISDTTSIGVNPFEFYWYDRYWGVL